jgi:hypothetical protein
MVKLSNKQPYIIHDINNSDFRVVEWCFSNTKKTD